MKWKIKLTPIAKKNLTKIQKGNKLEFARIKISIDKLMINPNSQGKKLGFKLQGLRSLRSGNYRVIFEVSNSEIIVHILLIGQRKDVYEKISRITDDK